MRTVDLRGHDLFVITRPFPNQSAWFAPSKPSLNDVSATDVQILNLILLPHSYVWGRPTSPEFQQITLNFVRVWGRSFEQPTRFTFWGQPVALGSEQLCLTESCLARDLEPLGVADHAHTLSDCGHLGRAWAFRVAPLSQGRKGEPWTL